MTLKWSEGEPRTGNVVDAGQVNKTYDSFKSTYNGNINRDNIPHGTVKGTHTNNQAFHGISLFENLAIGAKEESWVNAGSDLGPGGWTASGYEGGWFRLHKTNTLPMNEGMLHIELMGYTCYNMFKTQVTGGQFGNARGLEFKVHVNGMEVVRSPLYTYIIHPVHVVADVPVSGGDKTVEVFWRMDCTSSSDTSSLWLGYFGGLQLFLMNRFR